MLNRRICMADGTLGIFALFVRLNAHEDKYTLVHRP